MWLKSSGIFLSGGRQKWGKSSLFIFGSHSFFPFSVFSVLLGIVRILDTSLFSPVFLPHMGFLHLVYLFPILCCVCCPVMICAFTLSLLLLPHTCIFTASTIIFCHLLRTSEVSQKERPLEGLYHRVGQCQSCVIRGLILGPKICAVYLGDLKDSSRVPIS